MLIVPVICLPAYHVSACTLFEIIYHCWCQQYKWLSWIYFASNIDPTSLSKYWWKWCISSSTKMSRRRSVGCDINCRACSAIDGILCKLLRSQGFCPLSYRSQIEQFWLCKPRFLQSKWNYKRSRKFSSKFGRQGCLHADLIWLWEGHWPYSIGYNLEMLRFWIQSRARHVLPSPLH